MKEDRVYTFEGLTGEEYANYVAILADFGCPNPRLVIDRALELGLDVPIAVDVFVAYRRYAPMMPECRNVERFPFRFEHEPRALAAFLAIIADAPAASEASA